jgi:hypothetical protein
MKRIAIAAALVVSATAFSAALAASNPSPDASSNTDTDHRPQVSSAGDEGGASRVAEGFFDHFGGGEHESHHRHHWDEEDDDDGSASDDRGGANRPADPNAANAPVPDSGVFNGKARPKVEVR